MRHVTWLTTSGIEESLKSLKMASYFLGKTEEDKYHWKWMLVALHNSLQGFMACSLNSGDGMLALKDRVAEKWRAAEKNGQPLPKEELDTFLNLYKKINSNKMPLSANSKPFNPRSRQNQSVRKLNRLRNHFIHFSPKSWSLELNDLPKISQDCIQVIKFLAFKSGKIESSKELKHELSNEINDILSKLTRLDTIYKM